MRFGGGGEGGSSTVCKECGFEEIQGAGKHKPEAAREEAMLL